MRNGSLFYVDLRGRQLWVEDDSEVVHFTYGEARRALVNEADWTPSDRDSFVAQQQLMWHVAEKYMYLAKRLAARFSSDPEDWAWEHGLQICCKCAVLYDGRVKFTTYLYRALLNHYNAVRAHSRTHLSIDHEDWEDVVQTESDAVLNIHLDSRIARFNEDGCPLTREQQRHVVVHAILSELTDEERRLYELRFVKKLALVDVAANIGFKSKSTAMSRVNALLRKLKSKLEEFDVCQSSQKESPTSRP